VAIPSSRLSPGKARSSTLPDGVPAPIAPDWSPLQFLAFDPLAFLAEICAHIPDPHEKTAIYYGWYSNRTRGFRKARGLLPPVTPDQPTGEAERSPLALRRTWAS
jgi:hypothetical protein